MKHAASPSCDCREMGGSSCLMACPALPRSGPPLCFYRQSTHMVRCIKTCPHHIFLMPNENLASFSPCRLLTDPLCVSTVPQVIAWTRFDRGACTDQRTSPPARTCAGAGCIYAVFWYEVQKKSSSYYAAVQHVHRIVHTGRKPCPVSLALILTFG